jgi:hypothetical protein
MTEDNNKLIERYNKELEIYSHIVDRLNQRPTEARLSHNYLNYICADISSKAVSIDNVDFRNKCIEVLNKPLLRAFSPITSQSDLEFLAKLNLRKKFK